MGETKLVEAFQEAWGKYRKGLITEELFSTYRSLVGFHRSRDGSYFVRLRFPGGNITPSQAASLSAFLQDRIPEKKAFITPRQCVQAYGLKLEELPEILGRLKSCGLSSLRSGGHTVRNVTMCEGAGVCPRQEADPRDVVAALDDYFSSSDPNFPTRVKVAVSGCSCDCAAAGTHGLGLTGCRGPGRVPGFRALIGGGLGRTPRLAEELDSFVPFSETPRFVAKAVETFRRVAPMNEHAGLKTWIAREGTARFKAEMLRTAAPEGARDAREPGEPSVKAMNSDRPHEWYPGEGPHRIPGMRTFKVRVYGGWLLADQWMLLAHCSEKHGGELRLTLDQNILLTQWKEGWATASMEMLIPAGLAEGGAGTPEDPLSCPGSKYCRGAVGYDLVERLRDYLAHEGRRFQARRWKGQVRVSACDHQCGRTASAALGLSLAYHQDETGRRTICRVWMGGGRADSGWRLGRVVAEIPAEQAEETLKRVFEHYSHEAGPSENFEAYCARISEGSRPAVFSWLHPSLCP